MKASKEMRLGFNAAQGKGAFRMVLMLCSCLAYTWGAGKSVCFREVDLAGEVLFLTVVV